MTFSGLATAIRRSSMHSSRNGTKIDTLLLHHAATVSAATVVGMMVSGSRTVSANYVCGNDGQLFGIVDEENRAWTSGSSSDGGRGAAWDRRSITVETANESYGGSWPISERSYATLAALAADLHRRYGLKLDRDHVIGHRELWQRYRASYATACPGGMDLDRIVNLARAIVGQGGVVPAVGTSTPIPAAAYQEAVPVAEYQRLLIAKGYDLGPTGADGVKGPRTTAAVVAAQKAGGLDPDGLVGPRTVEWLRGGAAPTPAGVLAPAFPLPRGSYFGPRSGPATSVSGYFSHRADLKQWQQRMKDRGWAIDPDGLYGTQTHDVALAFQTEKGLDRDGLIGEKTWAAAWTAPVTA
jgi:N-acetyl-anhydromuramyl-L-alanine amidase AmpD